MAGQIRTTEQPYFCQDLTDTFLHPTSPFMTHALSLLRREVELLQDKLELPQG